MTNYFNVYFLFLISLFCNCTSIPKLANDDIRKRNYHDTVSISPHNSGSFDDDWDANAINAAIEKGFSVQFEAGTYIIHKPIILESNTKLVGSSSGETILLYTGGEDQCVAKIDDTTKENIWFEKIIFDLKSGENYFAPPKSIGNEMGLLRIKSGKNIAVTNSIFRNLKGIKDQLFVYAIELGTENVSGFFIDNVLFENISAVDTKNSTGKSAEEFAGAIYFFPCSATSGPLSKGTISHCTFKNIFTEDPDTTDAIFDYDADGIRFYSKKDSSDFPVYTADNDDFPVKITGNTFKNIQKSAVKVSKYYGILLDSNVIISDRGSNDDLRTGGGMEAAIRIQWGKNIKITNTTVLGSFKRIFNLVGEGITVDNLSIKTSEAIPITSITKAIVNLQRLPDIINKNIIIQNINCNASISPLIIRIDIKGYKIEDGFHTEDLSVSDVNISNSKSVSEKESKLKSAFDVQNVKNFNLKRINISGYTSDTETGMDITITDVRNATIKDLTISKLSAATKDTPLGIINFQNIENLTIDDVKCDNSSETKAFFLDNVDHLIINDAIISFP
jgi:hypothetical protein